MCMGMANAGASTAAATCMPDGPELHSCSATALSQWVHKVAYASSA